MTAKPKRDERGQFMPKWAAGLRTDVEFQATWLKHVDIALAEHTNELEKLGRRMNDLSSRLGTSTPLIIWNIAVLIAIAGVGVAVAKLYGVAP